MGNSLAQSTINNRMYKLLLPLLCAVWLAAGDHAAEPNKPLGKGKLINTGFLISQKCVAFSPASKGGVQLVHPVPKSAPASALVKITDSICADNKPCKTVTKCTPKDRRQQLCSLVCVCVCVCAFDLNVPECFRLRVPFPRQRPDLCELVSL
jgi:hypothetical protein